MEYVPTITAAARVAALVPLVMFFYRQGKIHARNGDVGRVRRATLGVVLFLALMFGNLVWVNIVDAVTVGVQGISFARWVALVASLGLAGALWWLWRVFCDIQNHHG
jgi:uncharacterized membrane protein YcgQ (UPF0703/DUF1980 family)